MNHHVVSRRHPDRIRPTGNGPAVILAALAPTVAHDAADAVAA